MKRNCLKCGKSFRTYPSKIALGRGKYCSKKCSNLATLIKKGQHLSPLTEFKRGNSPLKVRLSGKRVAWNKGTKGIIKANKGSFQKGERRSHRTEFKRGHKPSWTGGKRPELSGANHSNWLGGKSFEPYPLSWTEDLKNAIRKRDNYKCQECGCPQIECNRKLAIHHIDYDKRNLNPINLISLCVSCHSKTNRNREYWTNYFKGGDVFDNRRVCIN